MTFVESIKYYRKIILFFIGILAIIICLVMSKYNVEFSTTYAKLISILLILSIMSTFEHYWFFMFLFAISVAIFFKDTIKKNVIEGIGLLEKELEGTKDSLKQSQTDVGRLEAEKKQLEEKLKEVKAENTDMSREKKFTEMDLEQTKLANDTNSKEGNNDACNRAKEVIDDPTKYNSIIQKKAQKTMEKCMENFSNLAGFDSMHTNYNDYKFKHMINNFANNENQYNKSNNIITSNDKINIENNLYPVNTRFFG